MRKCTRCGQSKLIAEFTKDKRRKDGLGSWCKLCLREAIRKIERNKEPVMIGSKQCRKCDQILPVADFYPHRGGRDGRREICKSCQGIRTHYNNIKRLYGLEADVYDRMYAQGCHICGVRDNYQYGNKRRLTVDHCHETGQVRGILCDLCNFLIGNARNDPDILRKAADYLGSS